MIISAIVAHDRNRAIGKDGNIPWYLPADLKYFKRRTLGHPVIMGRKTFESIGRPLPKRTNIVLTRDPFYAASGIRIARNLAEALEFAAEVDSEEAFIIGGGEIYQKSLPLLNRMYVTEVDLLIEEADAFFPEIPPGEWTEIEREAHPADDRNEANYTFVVLERIPGS